MGVPAIQIKDIFNTATNIRKMNINPLQEAGAAGSPDLFWMGTGS